MKLRYLFALPILAMALMGCDEIESSTSKPVANEQLPMVNDAAFSVTAASALTNGLDLEKLNSETEDPANYMVPLYTINVASDANLPKGASLVGEFQLSTDNTFENPFNVDDLQIVDGVVSAPLSSLIYTRSLMYRKDPRVQTVYYRIPVYIDYEGGLYKIGKENSYFLEGNSFQEIGVYPGYTVEEAYYLVGPAGTGLNSALKFNHSGYNIYDDSTFSITAEFTDGNQSWLVVPMSVYESGTLDEAKCYGPQVAASLEGVLELGGEWGTLESGKKYDFLIDLSTLSYTITEKPQFELGDPTGAFLRGSMNGWGAPVNYEFIGTEDPNVWIIPYTILPSGAEFKIGDATWAGTYDFGGDGSPITPGVAYPLNGGANITINVDFAGSAIMTLQSDGSYTLLLQAFTPGTAGQASGIYARGDMNGWGTTDEFMTTEYAEVWILDNVAFLADQAFKVATSDWSTINLGWNGSGKFDETAETGILGMVGGDNPANVILKDNFNGDLRLVKVNDHYYLYFLLGSAAE